MSAENPFGPNDEYDMNHSAYDPYLEDEDENNEYSENWY